MAPTEKQIKYAWFLMKTTHLPLPGDWNTKQDICGAYIAWARSKLEERGHDYRHESLAEQIKGLKLWARRWCANSKHVDADIIRILSGGPLKHEPGPWDEGWQP